MIAKISRGWRVAGLVAYLMGPGRFNAHTEQRVVASWDGHPEAHQPPRAADGSFAVTDLSVALADPAVAAGLALREPAHAPGRRPARGPVWHCSLRNHADDRVLSDQEWAQVVEDLLHRTGIAVRGDLGACRWVAIRHAADHVHVAAVLVRQDDGRRVWPHNDYVRAGEMCRAAEQRLGLTRTAAPDRTASEHATRAEVEKAARRGAAEPSREWLRRAARVAAVQSRDLDSFFTRLEELGVEVEPRRAADGRLIGYKVSDPDPAMATASGGLVWFGGGTLARDLSLPKLLQRWASAPAPAVLPPAPGEHARIGRAERAAAVNGALVALERARSSVAAGTDGKASVAGIVHSASDMTVAARAVLARSCAALPARRAEEFYDRAAREARVGQPRKWGPVAAQLRSAAWRLAAIRNIGDPRHRDAGVTELIVAIAALIAEVAAYHEQRRCLAQASAARRAARALREHRAGAGRAPAQAGRTPELGGAPAGRPSPNRDDHGRRSGAGTPSAQPVVPGHRTQPPTQAPTRGPTPGPTRGRGRER